MTVKLQSEVEIESSGNPRRDVFVELFISAKYQERHYPTRISQ